MDRRLLLQALNSDVDAFSIEQLEKLQRCAEQLQKNQAEGPDRDMGLELALEHEMRSILNTHKSERASLVASIARTIGDADTYRAGKDFDRAFAAIEDAVYLVRALLRHDHATGRRIVGVDQLPHFEELECAAVHFENVLRDAIPSEIKREEAVVAFRALWKASAVTLVELKRDKEEA